MKLLKRSDVSLTFIAAMLLIAGMLLRSPAQTTPTSQSSSLSSGDSTQVKIVRAMSAGPANVAKTARIVDTDAQGKMVVLREGNNGFTCMPLRKVQPCSTIRLRPMGSTAFCGAEPMDGPVFRVMPEMPTMSPAALTRFFCSSSRTARLALRPTCSASEFHTCTVASGCPTSRTRWEAAMDST